VTATHGCGGDFPMLSDILDLADETVRAMIERLASAT
jgi:hypothetical protein